MREIFIDTNTAAMYEPPSRLRLSLSWKELMTISQRAVRDLYYYHHYHNHNNNNHYVQGYLAHKKRPPPQDLTVGLWMRAPTVVLGGGVFF